MRLYGYDTTLIDWDSIEDACGLVGHDWEEAFPGAERFCRICYLSQDVVETSAFGEVITKGWTRNAGDTHYLRKQYELRNSAILS